MDERLEPRSESATDGAGRGHAVAHATRWVGWIWAVPLAALAIAVWLGMRALAQGGPTVTVTFASAGGVKAGDTSVMFEKMKVGEVDSVKFHKDLKAVDVTLAMESDMAGHLGPGTRYWISGQNVSLADPSSIKSIISGPSIDVDPHDGDTEHHVRGLDEAPVLKQEPQGTRFVLHTDTLGSVSRGSPIYFRDLKVGEIEGYQFRAPDHFDIYAFVRAPYAALVHAGSRFWDASGAQVAMAPGGPTLRLQSVQALVSGAIDFETPEQDAGRVATADTAFPLYASRDAAEHAPGAQDVDYRVTLDDAAGAAIAPGAPVRLEGRRIGTVTGNVLRLTGRGDTLQSELTIALDPHALPAPASGETAGRAGLDAVFARLVAHGLRAQLGSTIPVVGGKSIDLRFVPGVPPATLLAGTPPGIPATSGGDIGQVMQQVSDVAGKIDALPLTAIADNIQQTTQRIAALSASPELTQSVKRLDATLANVDHISAQAREEVGPLLVQLRRTANEADATARAAHALVGAQGGGGPDEAGVPQAMYELTRAARSLRELADMLDRHPEALLTGKVARQ